METPEIVIAEILSLEWEMFSQVKSAFEAACQRNPQAFKKIRGTIFQFWPLELLKSYRDDLRRARDKGRNLIMEKYARMDDLIPALKTNPLIDCIVEIETVWQQAVKSAFPALHQRICRDPGGENNGDNFSVYLRSELETYGDQTLSLYYAWVGGGAARKENYSLMMLERLVKSGGFESIDQAEQYLRAQSQKSS